MMGDEQKSFLRYGLVILASVAATAFVLRGERPEIPLRLTGILENPCPALLEIPAELSNYRDALVDTATVTLPPLTSDAMVNYRRTLAARTQLDWANLCTYRAANDSAISGTADTARIVFMGDSITENWLRADDAFFTRNEFINRGIGGQTTSQMLLRFRADVIALQPRVVHILAGTNDIAGNTGPTTLRAIQENIESMVELALANNIAVIIGTVLPATKFSWRPELQPAEQIHQLNEWLRAYTTRAHIQLVDYESALLDSDGGLKANLSHDGVHPHKAGYAIMAPLAREAIQLALAGKK